MATTDSFISSFHKIESKMWNSLIRIWRMPRFFAPMIAATLSLASNSISQVTDINKLKMDRAAKRADFISRIKQKDVDPGKGSMRDFYVVQLANISADAEDPEVLALFLALIENDENDWIRLEAAADIHRLVIPRTMYPKVIAALVRCRNDKRVNFQVLASQSLIKIAKKRGKVDMQSINTVARVAQAQDMEKWEIMIPPHNVNTTMRVPGTKTEIPFKEYFKSRIRIISIEALSLSGDDFSKKVIANLSKDHDLAVRETAKAHLKGR